MSVAGSKRCMDEGAASSPLAMMRVTAFFLLVSFCAAVVMASEENKQIRHSNNHTESFFGIPLSTNREQRSSASVDSPYFMYERCIAAVSVFFFRVTVHVGKARTGNSVDWFIKYFFAVVLALLAYEKKDYVLIMGWEHLSYVIAVLAPSFYKRKEAWSVQNVLRNLAFLAVGAAMSFGLSHVLASLRFWRLLSVITPTWITRTLHYFLPVEEYLAAYNIILAVSTNSDDVHSQLYHLLFVTYHIQVGMGYLGIHFLQQEQTRRNDLIRLDVGSSDESDSSSGAEEHKQKEPQVAGSVNGVAKENRGSGPEPSSNDSTRQSGAEAPLQLQREKHQAKMRQRALNFQRGALPFILLTALPYMGKVIPKLQPALVSSRER
jgi:hypothetical protein